MQNINFFTNKKIIRSEIKIWKILLDYLGDEKEFKKLQIWEICKKYKIHPMTLRKYLKHYYKQKKGNSYYISIDDPYILEYIKDIYQIYYKYNWYIDNTDIKAGQYLLNNLRT